MAAPRYLTLVLILVGGFALSASLFFLVREKERLLAKADLEFQAQAQMTALKKQFAVDASVLGAGTNKDFQQSVDAALKDFEQKNFDIFFYEIRSEGDRFLFRTGDGPAVALSSEGYRVTLDLPGRQILAVMYPGQNENAKPQASLAWVVLAVGVLLTLVLGAHFFHMSKALHAITVSHEALKNAQSQLILADRLATLGQIAAGVAHEINNPVGFVSSNLETLEKYVQDLKNGKIQPDEKTAFILSEMKPLVAESREGLERVKKIVANLRTFARPEAEDAIERADLHRVLEGALSIAWNEIKHKAEVKKDYGVFGPVLMHSQQIGQVFINILVNASQAIEDKGEIRIRTFSQNGFAAVEILDNGRGLSAKAKKNLFQPFFTTKEVGKGTGLGLSISQEIIKKHRGRIEVESEAGKGAKFTVFLPL